MVTSYYKNNIETLVMYGIHHDGPIQSTTITITLLLLLLFLMLYIYMLYHAHYPIYKLGAALPILSEQILPSTSTSRIAVAQRTSVVPWSMVV
jgi:hypothetical protein